MVGAASLMAGCTVDVYVSGTCDYNGEQLYVGESVEDGCNACTCQEGGAVVCSDNGVCPQCEGLPVPDCGAPPPGCTVDTVCDGSQWTCTVSCGGCENAPPIDCEPPPPGCTMGEPSCVNGNWSCGPITCNEPCSDPEPICPQPDDPSCFSYALCGEFGWECAINCEPTCNGPMPDCPPNPDPNCFTSIECIGNVWQCVENCVMPVDCDAAYPGAYDQLIAAIVNQCGCVDTSPCAQSCAGTATCMTLTLDNTACGTCVENVAGMGANCVQDGAFGPQCQNNPNCAGYVDCLIQQQNP